MVNRLKMGLSVSVWEQCWGDVWTQETGRNYTYCTTKALSHGASV